MPRHSQGRKMLTALRKRLDARDEKGFTLIELLVVIIIIGILLAIGSRATSASATAQRRPPRRRTSARRSRRSRPTSPTTTPTSVSITPLSAPRQEPSPTTPASRPPSTPPRARAAWRHLLRLQRRRRLPLPQGRPVRQHHPDLTPLASPCAESSLTARPRGRRQRRPLTFYWRRPARLPQSSPMPCAPASVRPRSTRS